MVLLVLDFTLFTDFPACSTLSKSVLICCLIKPAWLKNMFWESLADGLVCGQRKSPLYSVTKCLEHWPPLVCYDNNIDIFNHIYLERDTAAIVNVGTLWYTQLLNIAHMQDSPVTQLMCQTLFNDSFRRRQPHVHKFSLPTPTQTTTHFKEQAVEVKLCPVLCKLEKQKARLQHSNQACMIKQYEMRWEKTQWSQRIKQHWQLVGVDCKRSSPTEWHRAHRIEWDFSRGPCHTYRMRSQSLWTPRLPFPTILASVRVNAWFD